MADRVPYSFAWQINLSCLRHGSTPLYSSELINKTINVSASANLSTLRQQADSSMDFSSQKDSRSAATNGSAPTGEEM